MSKNYAEHVVKGTALIFAMALATNIVSYLIRIFLARSLTPAEFGLVYASIAFISLLNIFRNLGMGQTMQKKIPEFLVSRSYGKIKYAMKFSFYIQFFYALIVLLAVIIFSNEIASTIFQTAQAVPILIVLSVFGLIHAANQTIITALQGMKRIRLYTGLEFFNYIFRFAFVILLIPLGTMALPYSQLAATSIFTVVGILVFTTKFPDIFRAKSKPISKELLAFSLPVMLSLIASTIIANFDTVLLSSLRSLEEVAMYQIALPLANVILILAGSIIIILLPLVSELWARHDKKTLRSMTELLTKALFAIVVPIAVIFITFPELAISMLFGDVYLPAAGALQLLVIATVFQGLGFIFATLLLGIDKPKAYTKIAFAIAAINVLANIVLIPAFGIIGAASALIITHVIGVFILLYFSRKNIEFHFQAFNFLKIIIGGAAMVFLISLIKSALVTNPWVELVAALVISFVFYFVYTIKTHTITRNEMKILFDTGLPIPKIIKNLSLRLAK